MSDHYEWRYLRTGRAVHALYRVSDTVALCGVATEWTAAEWRGTGSQAEYEKASALPKCRNCLRVAGR